MRRKLLLAGLAAAALGFFAVDQLHANPPQVPHPPRANFTMPIGFNISHVCYTPSPSDNPAAVNLVHLGIDGNGPYFAIYVKQFTPNAVMLTYRPRGQVTNTVAEFGDGAIHAVELFRKYYERWHRAQGVLAGPGPASNNIWQPPCSLSPQPKIEMTLTAEEWAGGPHVFVLLDPNTLCFEDYDFQYYPR